MKIKGKWEYVIEPENIIVLEEYEKNELSCYKIFNKYWYYFRDKWIGKTWAIVTANDGSIWVASDGGYIARWNGIEWIDEGQWCHGELAIIDLVVAKDGSIWAKGWERRFDERDKRKIWETICYEEEGYIFKVARWDGEKWEDMSRGLNVEKYGFLFVTPEGDIQIIDPEGYIQRWDGSKWMDAGRWFFSDSGWDI
ncbi:hypothetical protein M1N04_01595, partial [Peptococcaceae bacterium]|nr:hypothetical protein [Peptococcaceae bacterium]